MIDLITSTLEVPLTDAAVRTFKRDAFLAVLKEEEARLVAEPGLIGGIRAEVLAAMPD